MLNFTQKISQKFSNQVSTQLFPSSSNLFMPIISREKSTHESNLPKSLFLAQNELSIESKIETDRFIEENLAKSRRSKESIELKRSIIRKMNQKILALQKKSKNQKIDIFQLQACKNDLLTDFLEYEKSKRKHQEQLLERQDTSYQEEKSFFMMKNQFQEIKPDHKDRKSIHFIKNSSGKINSLQQKVTEINLIPIQICIPIIKMIDIEIPILNFGEKKIRQTGTTLPTNVIKGSEENHAGVSNQIEPADNTEIQNYRFQENLPSNSSLSKLLIQGRVLDLGTDRSEKSLEYRQGRGSDRYFVDEQDLIKNLNEKQQDYQNLKTQRKFFDNYQRQFHENMNKSFDKARNKSLNSSSKDLILENELKLNSLVSEKQSSNYQKKRISIEKQTKEFYQTKIIELKEDLKQKVAMINDLLDQNNKFAKEIEEFNQIDKRKEREMESANIKIQILEQKVEQFEKYTKEVQETAQINSNKLMNEIYHLSNDLQTKNQELGLMMDSMQVIERNSYNKQKVLMKQIENLQNTVQKMKEEIQYYKKRFQEEGIKLNFNEIEMISEAIEDREKMYEKNLEKLKGIYESEISELKKKFSTIEGETKELQEKNHFSKQSQLNGKSSIANPNMAVKEEQIREIMDLYDAEIQSRDQEIIVLKKQLNHCKMALFEALDMIHSENRVEKKSIGIQSESSGHEQFRSPHDEMVIHILKEKNRVLEDKLYQELINRKQMTQKLLKLEKIIQSDAQPTHSKVIQNIDSQNSNEDSHEYDLIQALTKELDTVMKKLKKQKESNKKLRRQVTEQRPCSPTSESRQILALKEKLNKMVKYTGLLQKEIREIYKVEECEAHQKIIQRLENQLKLNKTDRSSEKMDSIMGLTQ